MPTCISLKQARRQLLHAAESFTLYVKMALELWFQTVDELPCHAQRPSIAAATHLVQAALQQAPWPMQRGDARILAWQHKHLPGNSTAMQECVNSQLETAARRVSILQSLVSTKQQDHDAQMQARLVAEHNLYMHLKTLTMLFHLLLPIATLCSDMQWPGKASQHGHQQPQQRLQQGNELIRRIACSLNQTAGVRIHQLQHKEHIEGILKDLGAMATEAPEQLLTHYQNAKRVLCQTSIVWLILSTQLPSDHKGTVDILRQVYWPKLLQERHLLSQSEYTLAKQHLFHLVGSTTLLQQFPKEVLSQIGRWLLTFCQFSGNTLLKAGVPAEQVQHLQPWLVDAAAVDKPDVSQESGSCSYQTAGSQCPANACNTAGSSSRSVVGHKPSGTGDSTECGASGGDDDLDDMHALLKMMYGCTV